MILTKRLRRPLGVLRSRSAGRLRRSSLIKSGILLTATGCLAAYCTTSAPAQPPAGPTATDDAASQTSTTTDGAASSPAEDLVDSAKALLKKAARISSPLKEALTTADKAEAAADDVKNEVSVATAAATVQKTAGIPPGPAKSNLLKRVAASLAADENFSEARQTALADDAADQLEKARTLVLIARAERASKQTRQAWWTLHEAQQIALQLTDPDSVVAVFREIGAVETGLISDAGGKGATQLVPGAGDVISTVLDYGVPPQGYHEMEVLRNGGGPLREPTIVRHQYFYNGDRYFQGPVLRGGPTIVQAVHPRTQCLTQIRVTLPAGAPIVVYREDSISYMYKEIEAKIRFRKSGKLDLDYRQSSNGFARFSRKIKGGGPGFPELPSNGTTDAARGIFNGAIGNPLELVKRLPVISDLAGGSDQRIPGTLQAPQ